MFITARGLYNLLKSPNFISVSKMTITKFSDFAAFKKVLGNSKKIVVLTGAGISAESGIPVFRGAGGLWRTHSAAKLASLGAFQRNPSLVWEFYHYRRTVAFNAKPNKAHIALAKLEEECAESGRELYIITQNVDGLHSRAGSKNVIELHGALNRVKCMNPACKLVVENNNSPICEALSDRGDPSAASDSSEIPIAELPKCQTCNTLVRPNVVWFGECLSLDLLGRARELVEKCDLCLVIGTSMTVYPACELAPIVADAGRPVAEFSISEQPSRDNFLYHFPGLSSVTVPKALGYDNL